MKYERYTKHMTLIILIVQDTRQLQGIIAAEKAGEINQNNKKIQSQIFCAKCSIHNGYQIKAT